MNRLLITGARVYDHEGDVHQPAVGDVLVEGSVITAVGDEARRRAAAMAGCETIDARGTLLMPGLVNAHYHSYDLLAKGLIEDTPLDLWRQYTGRMGTARSAEEVRLRTLLGAAECLRNGITTVQDFSILAPLDEAIIDVMLDAYRSVGIRVVFSLSFRDLCDTDTIPYVRDLFPPELQELIGDRNGDSDAVIDFIRRQIDRHPTGNTAIHWALSPSAPHRCTPRLLEAVAELALRRHLPVYTHLYEAKGHVVTARDRYAADGGSLVRYLDRFGLVSSRLSVAHGLWATQEELELLAARGATVIVNANSNFKLKDGVPPINALRRSGVRLAFGCDCFSCSDVQNLFQSMKLSCLLASVDSPAPGSLNAAQAVRIATEGGAATAGLRKIIGAIRPGMKADLVLLDLSDPAFVPFNSAARQLVFSETGRAVRTVMVDGRVVVRDGRVISMDEQALHLELEARMPAYRQEFERMRRQLRPLERAFEEQAKRVNARDVGLDRFL